MADAHTSNPFGRSFVLWLGAVLITVSLLLWGIWVSRELMQPRERIVTVRLAETIARFVEAEARKALDPQLGQARTRAFLKAAEAAVHDMGRDGRVVLVAEAVVAGNVPDATAELEQRIAVRLGREPRP